jgi:hypothetical protein
MKRHGRSNQGVIPGRRCRVAGRSGRNAVPQTRTIVVLGALVLGMALTSGLLLVLEPGPRAPFSAVTLLSIDHGVHASDRLNDIDNPRAWKAIVIHDSGQLTGSARSINDVHERLGRKGLGYHFVINNGTGASDGVTEVGFRWPRQFEGAYVPEPQSSLEFDWNANAIGICLVGDADRRAFTEAQLRELVWLVQQLQARFNIPADAVYVEVGSTGDQPSRLFPYAWFRGQLLAPRLP